MARHHIRLAAAISLILGSASVNASITFNYSGVDRDMSFWPPEDGGGPQWAWTNGDPGYTGNLPASWVAFIHNSTSSAVTELARSADAGFTIGVGARAFKDGSTNWGHNADFGLFRLDQAAKVTITMSSDDSDLRPGFGLWSGWATGGSRHGTWLANGAIQPMSANPLYSGLGLVDANAWTYAANQGSSATTTLIRTLAAGDYTIIMGGYDGTTLGPNLAYSVSISAAPVPLPGAVWLFGSIAAAAFAQSRQHRTRHGPG